MSRVVFLALGEGEVLAKCQTAKVGVSAIEALPGGGVRLVCMSSTGAAKMAKTLKRHVIAQGTDTERSPHRPDRPLW